MTLNVGLTGFLKIKNNNNNLGELYKINDLAHDDDIAKDSTKVDYIPIVH